MMRCVVERNVDFGLVLKLLKKLSCFYKDMVHIMTSETKEMVRSEIMVAIEIYELSEVKKEPATFSKIVENLGLEKSVVIHDLNMLSDWCIVKRQYGEVEKGRAGSMYFICSEVKDSVAKWHSDRDNVEMYVEQSR